MMELDDLKQTWDDANEGLGKEPGLTTIIDRITPTKYRSKLKKIAYPEMVGTVVAFIGAAYIIFNFVKLNTFFYQCLGVFTILYLLVMPIISLMILRQLDSVGDVTKPYAETLKNFATQKVRFIKFQKASVLTAYVLMVCVMLLCVKFFSKNLISDHKLFWICSFSFGYIFLYFFSKWVLGKYGKALRQAEELLREVE